MAEQAPTGTMGHHQDQHITTGVLEEKREEGVERILGAIMAKTSLMWWNTQIYISQTPNRIKLNHLFSSFIEVWLTDKIIKIVKVFNMVVRYVS